MTTRFEQYKSCIDALYNMHAAYDDYVQVLCYYEVTMLDKTMKDDHERATYELGEVRRIFKESVRAAELSIAAVQ